MVMTAAPRINRDRLQNSSHGRHGRRGDPRMNRAVQAREANPRLSLIDALIVGGFSFPEGLKDRNAKIVYDSDGVTLYQRKNQLMRRQRAAKQKDSVAGVLKQKRQFSLSSITSQTNSASQSGKFCVKVESDMPVSLSDSELAEMCDSIFQPFDVMSAKETEKDEDIIDLILSSKEIENDESMDKVNEISFEDIALEESFYPQDAERQVASMTDKEKAELAGDLYGTSESSNTFSPESIDALNCFEEALSKVQNSDKEAVIQAQTVCPHLVGQQQKELFLKWAGFDAERAVARFVAYWDKRRELFGEEAFFPLTFDRMSEMDKATLQAGIYSLPQKDRHGRAVFCIYPCRQNYKKHETESEVRCAWYIIHSILEDVMVQKKGLVLLFDWKMADITNQFDRNFHRLFWCSLNDLLPIHVRAAHLVSPPLLAHLTIPFIKFLSGRRMRVRFILHGGTDEEIEESISKYGVPYNLLMREKKV